MTAASDVTSRDQILDAAERLFAARGFARTTIKDIGIEAGLNSALLYYYFADKDELYREVLRRFVSRLVARTMSELTAAGSPEARVRALLTAQAEMLLANPHFPRLMVRELAESDGAHAVEQFHLLAATTFRRLCELIEEGQRAGIFREEGRSPLRGHLHHLSGGVLLCRSSRDPSVAQGWVPTVRPPEWCATSPGTRPTLPLQHSRNPHPPRRLGDR